MTRVPPPHGTALRPVVLPDVSRMQASGREQLRERYSKLSSMVADGGGAPQQLADAYGHMGMLLHAATYVDAAESCYMNAQALAPADRRWPYYLGHVYRVRGPLDKAVASFEQALRLRPDDVPTLVWLGEVHLTQGRPAVAEPLFARALSMEPGLAVARAGIGRAALAAKDYARAAKELEAARRLEPRATAIHYPLAMAYRGLGDLDRARAYLASQGGLETGPADPLMRDLEQLLETADAHSARGRQAADEGDWPRAVESFRKGLALAPGDSELRLRLATALAQMGDTGAAVEQLEEVVRATPDHTRALFSLGVLMEVSGRPEDAINRLSTALRHEPGYVEARVQLARVLAHSGRAEEALVHYEQAIALDPASPDAVVEHAMTLIRLRRYAEARNRLAAGMKTPAHEATLRPVLARLLAAAPDDRVRDGRLALRLVEQLVKEEQSLQLGETTAMAFAELGQYEEAAAVQRNVIAAAQQAGLATVVARLTANLRLYERGEPCRMPFADDEWP
jgi:tetratricopeptide (TPR) repeat protein